MQWEVVIGIETHAQLTTASKIFSGASTALRRRAKFAGQRHRSRTAWHAAGVKSGRGRARDPLWHCDRRRDRPAQHLRPQELFLSRPAEGLSDQSIRDSGGQGRSIDFRRAAQGRRQVAGEPYVKTVKLTRAHLEEDAGKSLHEDVGADGVSGIDLNRAGVPLLEIVSEPELRSAAEAVAYAKAMHALVIWLDVCDGNMQEGSFRCDANVSVRPAGETRLGTRCEIKNLNSFRFLERAIEFEVRRQIELIEDGGTVVQETRLYDSERDETRPMRGKEDAMDYRYFPDPDLLPLAIADDWIERVRRAMPELAGCDARALRASIQPARVRRTDADRVARSRRVLRIGRGACGRQENGRELGHGRACSQP